MHYCVRSNDFIRAINVFAKLLSRSREEYEKRIIDCKLKWCCQCHPSISSQGFHFLRLFVTEGFHFHESSRYKFSFFMSHAFEKYRSAGHSLWIESWYSHKNFQFCMPFFKLDCEFWGLFVRKKLHFGTWNHFGKICVRRYLFFAHMLKVSIFTNMLHLLFFVSTWASRPRVNALNSFSLC